MKPQIKQMRRMLTDQISANLSHLFNLWPILIVQISTDLIRVA